MNILMLSYEFPPLGGGGGNVVYGLSRELVRLGHTVDLVTMGFRGLPRREQVNGVNIHRVPCIRKKESICTPIEMLSYVVLALPLINKLVRQKKYDLNHTHFIFPDGLLAYFVKRMTKLRYVMTAHGSDVPGYNPNRFKLMHWLLFPIWKMVVRDADQVIFPSQSLMDLFHRHSSNRKTVVIPNGIDLGAYQAGIPKKKRILTVTRMFERKGIQYLIQALKGLTLEHEVHIVGDGPYLPMLRGMAKTLKVPITFWGWLDHASPKLKELYETSSIFALPSAVENFPVVLLEAMAAGMAIVTTKGTGCQEVVGDAGVLVIPRDQAALRDALVKLAYDPALCKKLGEAARKRLEDHFSLEAVTCRHEALYQCHAQQVLQVAGK